MNARTIAVVLAVALVPTGLALVGPVVAHGDATETDRTPTTTADEWTPWHGGWISWHGDGVWGGPDTGGEVADGPRDRPGQYADGQYYGGGTMGPHGPFGQGPRDETIGDGARFGGQPTGWGTAWGC